MRSVVICAMGVAVLLSMACVAGADPYPDQVPKFSQLPMIATPIPTQVEPGGPVTDVIYYGHDELSTAWDMDPDGQWVYDGRFMADDFADTVDTPVFHITWWGSYMNREQFDDRRVDRFVIAFENDIPKNTPDAHYEFSHPDCWDAPLNSQISMRDADGAIHPAPGMFTETLVPGSNPLEPVYKYNAELAIPFPQEKNTVYWLKIVALVDHDPQMELPPLEWGWHNRDYTMQNPLASTRPAVIPGEDIQGWIDIGTPGIPEDGIPVWHFQDDAVSGDIDNIEVLLDSTDPQVQVHMDQDHWVLQDPSLNDEHYVDYVDGPGPDFTGFEGIGQYSKDLAFELFTLPGTTPPRPGDADLSGYTDSTDFSIMLASYGLPGNWLWGNGDFDYSTGGVNEVNSTDFSILLTEYGLTTPWPHPVTAPEPSTIVMLILGALCLVGYRVRK